MTDNNTNSSFTSIGFPGIMALLFIALKLLGKIDWPWVWVLSPLWLPLLVFSLIAIFGIFMIFRK